MKEKTFIPIHISHSPWLVVVRKQGFLPLLLEGKGRVQSTARKAVLRFSSFILRVEVWVITGSTMETASLVRGSKMI